MSGSIGKCAVLLLALSTGGDFAQAAICGFRVCGPPPPPPVPPGSCLPSSSLGVLVTGTNVVAYFPKGAWDSSTTGVSAVNIEGTSITPTKISTPNVTNSCASNPVTGKTVCVANNTDVYVLTGTTLSTMLTSSGSGTISFSGGSCTNCSVVMDAVHNKAGIGLSIAGAPGFQILNLANSVFQPEFKSPSTEISEDPLIDPIRRLLLSAAENNNYEIVNVASFVAPTFFENTISHSGFGEADSSGEDCATGIALAPGEFSEPSQVFIADLTQAVFTSGTPKGTWTAPSQVQTLTESFLSAGASGLAVAQGTHTGIVNGEFGGNAITAIALPATSGTGVPAITDWVSCNISTGFNTGLDPHTVTAYQSPNGAKDAIALVGNGGATQIAVVDLTKMLNKTIVPRTVGGHGCTSVTLPASVVSFVTVP
ncbi:MAG TPA: hypothetical protein VHT02_10105 [Methylocella sp.]|nr:hypothetical protein [Methylocella sp.]